MEEHERFISKALIRNKDARGRSQSFHHFRDGQSSENTCSFKKTSRRRLTHRTMRPQMKRIRSFTLESDLKSNTYLGKHRQSFESARSIGRVEKLNLTTESPFKGEEISEESEQP